MTDMTDELRLARLQRIARAMGIELRPSGVRNPKLPGYGLLCLVDMQSGRPVRTSRPYLGIDGVAAELEALAGPPSNALPAAHRRGAPVQRRVRLLAQG